MLVYGARYHSFGLLPLHLAGSRRLICVTFIVSYFAFTPKRVFTLKRIDWLLQAPLQEP